VREEDDDIPPQPSWGRPGPTGPAGGNGLGPSAASWGRPGGGIPGGPAGIWGRPNLAGNGIPAGAAQVDRSNYVPGSEDLSPLERRAMEKVQEQRRLQQEAQDKAELLIRQRRVSIHAGPGPETNRGGRIISSRFTMSEHERQAAERRELARKQALERTLEEQRYREAVMAGSAEPRITKRLSRVGYEPPPPAPTRNEVPAPSPWGQLRTSSRAVLGDYEPVPQAPRRNEAPSNWNQLRKKDEPIVETQRPPQPDRFAEARAQREAESRPGAFVPLARRTGAHRINLSRDEPPKLERYKRQEGLVRTIDGYDRARETGEASESLNDSRSGNLSRTIPDRPTYPPRQERSRETAEAKRNVFASETDHVSRASRSVTFDQLEPQAAYSRSRSDTPEKQEESVSFQPLFTRESEVVEKNARIQASRIVTEKQEDYPRSGREKRAKKSRSQYSEEQVYDMPKGKAKDKAKRRQQFKRTQEDQDAEDEALARAEAKRQRKREKAALKAAALTPMLLPEYISVSNLAVALKVRFADFVEKMEELGFEETAPDFILNAENAGLIAQEYGFEPIIDRSESEDLKAREPAADPSILPQRPPVVTIMGHVDHGKTTILDWLRKSSVAATEHGGITQHIGAFSVPMPSGKIITFLDTPGHAAFLSMRQRGANVTDIVILVVAADDSVKPQTIEAINHAKAAKVPIIVAINKIDKEETNVERVKKDLSRYGIVVEDYGGDIQAVCVSGKTGQGMEELEEAAVTLSEILDMRAEIDGPAEGWVLEASIKSMGKVATVLVRRGTMRPGDFIVAGKTWARIRCLRNEAGIEIEEAGPGTPVEIDGWREQPLAGDEVLQAPDEAKAKSVSEYRLEKEERDKMAEDMEAINEHRKADQERREREKAEAKALAEAKKADEELPETTKESKPTGPKEVYFVVKGDVSGSVEAVLDSIAALGNKEVQPHILRSGVGQLSEFDIEHAAAAKGLLINFNTTVEPNIAQLAAHAKVSILDHNIIYRLVDEVKAELSKHLPPLITQRVMGEAEIAQIFEINVKGRQQKNIAGCKVRNGTISKSGKVRVMRDGEKVFDGMFLLSFWLFVIGLDEVLMRYRYTCFIEERQERCYGDEERYRMWDGL
jgi:translation initiation factor IF-2